jgi:histidine triad (HIT) family protein
VPHAHMHLVPVNNAEDLNFSREKISLSKEEFLQIQRRLVSAI